MLLLLVAAVLVGFPTAFTLMALGIIFGFIGFQWNVFDLLVNKAFQLMTNDVLISIPVFLLMGYVMERAGLLDNLFRGVLLAAGGLRGSLAVATLVTGTIFGIASGIVGAGVALLGVIAFPAMLKQRYDPAFASGVIAAAGTLGILIPPSVQLILYSYVAGVSVARLYAAAFIPGFLLAGLYLIYVLGRAHLQKDIAPALPVEERGQSAGEVTKLLLKGLVPITILTVGVLGAILFGFATPTESASLGALGAVVLAAIYGRLNFQMIKESVFLTMRTAAMVGWLLVGSSLFSGVFALLGGSKLLGEVVNGLGLNAIAFVIVAQIIIFVLGWPLEWTEITIIFLPLFLPLLDQMGVDKIFFGVLMAVNLQTAFLSPPVAMSAYYLLGVAPKGSVTLGQIFRGMVPYMFICMVGIVIIWVFQETVFWLPRVLFG